ncbi:MAG: Peptide deformylase [Parcubacteria group bacterium GW2011_GWA2_47_7]|nr:MAG: Peptide deformylase [Parcubacteria group bacterium GW2011_GWA2_47_7]
MKESSEKKINSTIVQQGNPVLREIALTVQKSEFGTKKLLDILDAMNTALNAEFDGVAIAAPQIGVSLRIFIVSKKAFVFVDNAETENDSNATKMPEKNMVCINPEIIKVSRKRVKVPEGCLSVRWYYGNTLRHEKATIRAYDENGKLFTYGGSGLIAQIFQHETDHLNGTLFIDHATEIAELSAEEIAEIEAKNKKG